MIDNSTWIKSLLNLHNSPDTYYHLQILKRRKDNPDMTKREHIVMDKFIDGPDHLTKLLPELRAIAEATQARVMINVTPRTYSKTGPAMLQDLAALVPGGDYRKAARLFTSTTAKNPGRNKLWVLDIDPPVVGEHHWITNELCNTYIDKDVLLRPNVRATIPTPNGIHYIMTPFNLQSYNLAAAGTKWGQYIDVKKDAHTILYVPKSINS